MSDDDLISEWYAGCFRRLVVQLYAVSGNVNEAQEAVQEAFTRALAAPRRSTRLENPEAWLRRVAVNVCTQPASSASGAEQAAAPDRPPPAAVVDRSLSLLRLPAALRSPPEGQRHALVLHYLADLPVDGVTTTLSVSAGTVKSRLEQGRQALAELLAESDINESTSTGRIDVRL